MCVRWMIPGVGMPMLMWTIPGLLRSGIVTREMPMVT